MRKAFLAGVAALTLSASAVLAQTVVLDLHDYDDELMRTLDQTVKYFEPDISAGNALGAAEDAQVLADGYKWMVDYFQKKGPEAEPATKLALLGQAKIAEAMTLVGQKKFDAAADAAHEAAKTCRACHDSYKPLKTR